MLSKKAIEQIYKMVEALEVKADGNIDEVPTRQELKNELTSIGGVESGYELDLGSYTNPPIMLREYEELVGNNSRWIELYCELMNINWNTLSSTEKQKIKKETMYVVESKKYEQDWGEDVLWSDATLDESDAIEMLLDMAEKYLKQYPTKSLGTKYEIPDTYESVDDLPTKEEIAQQLKEFGDASRIDLSDFVNVDALNIPNKTWVIEQRYYYGLSEAEIEERFSDLSKEELQKKIDNKETVWVTYDINSDDLVDDEVFSDTENEAEADILDRIERELEQADF